MEEPNYITLVTNFNNNKQGNIYYLNNSNVQDNNIEFNEIFNTKHDSVSVDTLEIGNNDKVLLIKKSDTIKEYKIVNDVQISDNLIKFNPISVDWQEDKDIILNSLFDYEPTVENTTNVLSKLARNIFMETNYFKLNSLTAENIKNITNKEKIQEFMKLVYITEKDGFNVEKDNKNYNLVMHPAVNNANPAVNNAIHIFNYIDKINNTKFEENKKNIIENNKQKIQELLDFKDKQNTKLNEQQNTELLEFNNKINNIINDTENNNIITFLKINNDADTDTKPNILFNQVFDSIKETQSRRDIRKNTLVKKTTEITKSTSMILTHKSVNYLFGNFQQIFTTQSPADIAYKMDIITNNIINKKPVFLLNCGLYKDKKMPLLVNDNNDNNDNSIIYNLCKSIQDKSIQDKSIQKSIDYIRVTIQDIYNINTILNNEIFTLNDELYFENDDNKEKPEEKPEEKHEDYKELNNHKIEDLDEILSDNINKNIYPNLIYISFYSKDNEMIKSAGDLIICDYGIGNLKQKQEHKKIITEQNNKIKEFISVIENTPITDLEQDVIRDTVISIRNEIRKIKQIDNEGQHKKDVVNDVEIYSKINKTINFVLTTLGISVETEKIILPEKYNDLNTEIVKQIVTSLKHINNKLLRYLHFYSNDQNHILRKELNHILSVKHANSNALFNSPNYIDICLESYCPTNQNCFKIQETKQTTDLYNKYIANYEKSNFKTEIKISTDEIYKKYKDNEPNNKEGKKEFYKDIVICVFGTFDTSQLSSNSENPYIDINPLKQIFYNKETDNYEKKLNYELDKLDKFGNLKDDIKNILEKTNQEIVKPPSPPTDNNNKDIQKIIEKIDNINASTGIGTLEFLDQLSKFGSVNNLCSIDKTNFDYNPYLDNDDFNLIENKYKPENKIKM